MIECLKPVIYINICSLKQSMISEQRSTHTKDIWTFLNKHVNWWALFSSFCKNIKKNQFNSIRNRLYNYFHFKIGKTPNILPYMRIVYTYKVPMNLLNLIISIENNYCYVAIGQCRNCIYNLIWFFSLSSFYIESTRCKWKKQHRRRWFHTHTYRLIKFPVITDWLYIE